MNEFNIKLTVLFPFIAVALSVTAVIFPGYFVAWKSGIVPVLGLIMLFMGLTLTLEDIKKLSDKKIIILSGVLIQFLVMPFVAYLLSVMFGANPDILAGMILVGSSAGGTASNVICYLARGNVALSVAMTSLSTLCAVFFMPLMTGLYAGSAVEVPVFKMLLSLFQIVIVPVFSGMLIRKLFEDKIKKIQPAVPFATIMLISFIISVIAALNKGNILNSGLSVYVMVIMHNCSGLALGYFLARALKYDIVTSRTIAIEVGMQNSGLSVAMAIKHFSYAAALPGAVFSIWHNISGSVLSAFWNRKNK
jgi:BASS family bile acid:Na+ symporter